MELAGGDELTISLGTELLLTDGAEADQPIESLEGIIYVELDQCFLNLMCTQITWGSC